MPYSSHIHPTQQSGKAFYQRQIKGEVVMLNLLKFKQEADYCDAPHLAPPAPVSGQAAYQLYIEHTLPFLKEAGSEVLFYGKGGPFLIGPADEQWDAVIIVKHQSTEHFMDFASNEAYLKRAGHRTAALVDSRLLPMEEISIYM